MARLAITSTEASGSAKNTVPTVGSATGDVVVDFDLAVIKSLDQLKEAFARVLAQARCVGLK